MYNQYKKLNDYFKKYSIIKILENISTSKILLGIFMIFMYIGSRYIELRLTNGQEMILKNIAREVLIFTISFIATKDLLTSFAITAVFIILAQYILNQYS